MNRAFDGFHLISFDSNVTKAIQCSAGIQLLEYLANSKFLRPNSFNSVVYWGSRVEKTSLRGLEIDDNNWKQSFEQEGKQQKEKNKRPCSLLLHTSNTSVSFFIFSGNRKPS